MEPSSNLSNSTAQNHSGHAGVNPVFMAQGFGTPLMPAYYQSQQCMPFQNMMGHSFNPMMYTMPDQAAMSSWKSGSPFPANSAGFSPNIVSPHCLSQPGMLSAQGVPNLVDKQNIPPPEARTATKSNVNSIQPSSRDALKPKNSFFDPLNASSASTSGHMQTPYNDNKKTSADTKLESSNKEKGSKRGVASLMEDKPGEGSSWFKGKTRVKQRKNETSEPMDIDLSTNPIEEGSRCENMHILVGSVEDILKWSSTKKNLSSPEVLMQCIGVFVKLLKSDPNQALLSVRGLKPNSPSLQVVFYPFDRSMLPLAPNQIILFTGYLKGSRKFQAYDFEVLESSSPSEIGRGLGRVFQFSKKAVQDFS